MNIKREALLPLITKLIDAALSAPESLEVFVDYAGHTKGVYVRVKLAGRQVEDNLYHAIVFVDEPNAEIQLQLTLSNVQTLITQQEAA